MLTKAAWKEMCFAEICDEIYDGPHATPEKIDRGPVFLSISSLVNGRIDLSESAHLSEQDFVKWTRRIVPRKDDLVFSYETRLGEAALIPDGLKDVTQSADLLGSVAQLPLHFGIGRLTQDTVKLKFAKNAPSRNIVYRTLLTPEYRAHCRSQATGTTNLGLAREDFLSYPLIVPTIEVQNVFDSHIDSIERQIAVLENQSRTLATLRDTLLPKLLRGELSVTTASVQLEKMRPSERG